MTELSPRKPTLTYSNRQMRDKIVLERTLRMLCDGGWRVGGRQAIWGKRCTLGWLQRFSESNRQYRRVVNRYVGPVVNPMLDVNDRHLGTLLWFVLGYRPHVATLNDKAPSARTMVLVLEQALDRLDAEAVASNPTYAR
jgi:hypothetical protein